MAPPPRACLVHALLTLCDDVFFAVAATARLDADALRAFGRRREAAVQAVARGAPPEPMDPGEAWVTRLCAAIAPIAPPRWMPMAEVIEEGVSLELGARGVRSWFTSRPSEKDVARVRRAGAFAVRALASVLGAACPLSPAGQLLRGCVAASLGLPEEERRVLAGEDPVAVEALEVPEGMAPSIARAVLRGAFTAAMREGEGPREEQAVLVLGRRTGLPAEEVTAVHGEARRAVEATAAFGGACVEAIRHVLADDADEGGAVAVAAARLMLPSAARREAIAAVNAGPPPALAQRHALDRRQREAVLGVSWAAALRSDPTLARRLDRAARHDTMAADLGDAAAGREARHVVEAFLDEELMALVPLVPAAMG